MSQAPRPKFQGKPQTLNRQHLKVGFHPTSATGLIRALEYIGGAPSARMRNEGRQIKRVLGLKGIGMHSCVMGLWEQECIEYLYYQNRFSDFFL